MTLKHTKIWVTSVEVLAVDAAAAEAVPPGEDLEEEEGHLAEVVEAAAGAHPVVEEDAEEALGAEEASAPEPGCWSSPIQDLRVFTFWAAKTRPFARRI